MAASKEGYRIFANTVPELVQQLSFHLQSIANRLDQIEGFRGTSTINSDLDLQSNTLLNVGNFDQNLGTADEPVFGGLTIDGDVAATGAMNSNTSDVNELTVTDSNGTIIHQLGEA